VTKYWVKANEGSLERGPFTLDELERKLYGGSSLVRPHGGVGEWTTLAHVQGTAGRLGPYRAGDGPSDGSEGDEDLAQRTAVRIAQQGRRRVLGGVALIGLGIAITVVSYSVAATSSGGGRYYVTTGLFVIGVMQIVRGWKAT
jgi:hypothetical protein